MRLSLTKPSAKRTKTQKQKQQATKAKASNKQQVKLQPVYRELTIKPIEYLQQWLRGEGMQSKLHVQFPVRLSPAEPETPVEASQVVLMMLRWVCANGFLRKALLLLWPTIDWPFTLNSQLLLQLLSHCDLQ